MAALALARTGLHEDRVVLPDAYHLTLANRGHLPQLRPPRPRQPALPRHVGVGVGQFCECIWPESDEEAEDAGVAPEDIV